MANSNLSRITHTVSEILRRKGRESAFFSRSSFVYSPQKECIPVKYRIIFGLTKLESLGYSM